MEGTERMEMEIEIERHVRAAIVLGIPGLLLAALGAGLLRQQVGLGYALLGVGGIVILAVAAGGSGERGPSAHRTAAELGLLFGWAFYLAALAATPSAVVAPVRHMPAALEPHFVLVCAWIVTPAFLVVGLRERLLWRPTKLWLSWGILVAGFALATMVRWLAVR